MSSSFAMVVGPAAPNSPMRRRTFFCREVKSGRELCRGAALPGEAGARASDSVTTVPRSRLSSIPGAPPRDAPSGFMGVVVRLCGQFADQGFEVFAAERDDPRCCKRRVVNGEADLRLLRLDPRVIPLAFLSKQMGRPPCRER